MIRRPPISPLFPSPTLFRSDELVAQALDIERAPAGEVSERLLALRAAREGARTTRHRLALHAQHLRAAHRTGLRQLHRSEEHTSELQSRLHLVCRLLLAKKK